MLQAAALTRRFQKYNLFQGMVNLRKMESGNRREESVAEITQKKILQAG